MGGDVTFDIGPQLLWVARTFLALWALSLTGRCLAFISTWQRPAREPGPSPHVFGRNGYCMVKGCWQRPEDDPAACPMRRDEVKP